VLHFDVEVEGCGGDVGRDGGRSLKDGREVEKILDVFRVVTALTLAFVE
jgi:hypothetical protein